jgi:predicted transposase/invertase (TIGR01784 family)
MGNITGKEEKNSTARKDINTPHDRVVEKFFQENETARSLFREYLPKEIVGLLDLDSLEYLKDKFVDENLAKYYSDLLYKVNYADHLQGFIFLLLEHKSTELRFSSFQVLKYMVQIWDKFLVNHKKARHLPVIIPVVLYHGGKKWKLANRFSALFKYPVILKEFIPDFQFQLLDISHAADEEIKGSTALRILLMTLKYIFKPELKDKLQEILRLFLEIKDTQSVKITC